MIFKIRISTEKPRGLTTTQAERGTPMAELAEIFWVALGGKVLRGEKRKGVGGSGRQHSSAHSL